MSFNIESFEIPWVIIDNNYESFVRPKKPEPRSMDKSLIIEKSLVLPIERYESYTFESKEFSKEVKKEEKFANEERVLYCENNHKLVWSYNVILENYLIRGKGSVKCCYCGKIFFKPCWHCLECAFDICEECGKAQGAKCPKLLCDKNHELSWRCTVAEKNRNITGNAI